MLLRQPIHIKTRCLHLCLFGDSSAFSYEHIKEYFLNSDWKFLPNIICLYDKGLIVNINKTELENKIFKVNLYPEFLKDKREENEWILLKLDKKGVR